MNSNEKLNKIIKFIDDFKTGINDYPACWGTLEDIDAMSFIVDTIDNIINFNDIKAKNISFRDYLLSVGCNSTLTISKQIRNAIGSDDNVKLYNEYNRLRNEYYKWRDEYTSNK